MKAVLLLALVSVLSFPLSSVVSAEKPDGESRGHGVIVELREGESIQRINALFGSMTLKHVPATSTYLLAAPAGISDEQLTRLLANSGSGVVFAEPNRAFKGVTAQQFSLAFDGQYSFAVPNPEAEAMYRNQWDVYKTHLLEAQDLASGSGTIVALVDTGADLTHPALAGKFSAGGYNFVDNNADPSDLPNGIDDDGDGYVDEATGHGTFLAGIVALVAPEVSLMPLRVLNSDGWGTVYDVAAAIIYAADHGANIINVSLGMNSGSKVLEKAVDYAYAKNAVLVASVGNRLPEERTGNILYPARYSKAVAVAATNSDDLKSSFSNWGVGTDLSAPGETIYSTYYNGGFAWWSGTSMASAFVSGGAALVKGLHPDWTRDQVVSRLTETATNIDGFNYSQYRGKLGAGRIDFYAAVR